MEAGVPPRGWRGRVLWLVSVEVSCCFDPVRVGGRAGGRASGAEYSEQIWGGMVGKLRGFQRALSGFLLADARLVFGG